MWIYPLSSGSKGNAIVISDEDTNILLDCGIPYGQIQKKSNFIRLDGCLVTHNHQDHCKATKDLQKYGIECYSPDNTPPIKQFSIGTFDIIPFELEHDVTCYGYQLTSRKTKESAVYITDTAYCRYKFKDINYFIVECNYIKNEIDTNMRTGTIHHSLRNRIISSHMSLDTLKSLLQANNISVIKQIWITHVSKSNGDKQIILNEIKKLTGKEVYI